MYTYTVQWLSIVVYFFIVLTEEKYIQDIKALSGLVSAVLFTVFHFIFHNLNSPFNMNA